MSTCMGKPSFLLSSLAFVSFCLVILFTYSKTLSYTYIHIHILKSYCTALQFWHALILHNPLNEVTVKITEGMTLKIL